MQASSRTKIAFAIAGSVVIGILLGSTVFAGMLSRTASGTQNQALTISGTETIKVIGPDGKVVSTWQGPDPLTVYARNAIASCVGGTNGGNLSPLNFGSCSTWITRMGIYVDHGNGQTCTITSGCSRLDSAATNFLTPAGCNPSSGTPNLCSGWSTVATFLPNLFTTVNCGTSCHVQAVVATNDNSWAWDELCTHTYATTDASNGVNCTLGGGAIPPVSPGDTLVVTIDFSVN